MLLQNVILFIAIDIHSVYLEFSDKLLCGLKSHSCEYITVFHLMLKTIAK